MAGEQSPQYDMIIIGCGPAGATAGLVLANFSYHCRPYAGAGHFLVGDAAAFLDPIFCTGVCLAMSEAVEAAELIGRVLRQELSPSTVTP